MTNTVILTLQKDATLFVSPVWEPNNKIYSILCLILRPYSHVITFLNHKMSCPKPPLNSDNNNGTWVNGSEKTLGSPCHMFPAADWWQNVGQDWCLSETETVCAVWKWTQQWFPNIVNLSLRSTLKWKVWEMCSGCGVEAIQCVHSFAPTSLQHPSFCFPTTAWIYEWSRMRHLQQQQQWWEWVSGSTHTYTHTRAGVLSIQTHIGKSTWLSHTPPDITALTNVQQQLYYYYWCCF